MTKHLNSNLPLNAKRIEFKVNLTYDKELSEEAQTLISKSEKGLTEKQIQELIQSNHLKKQKLHFEKQKLHFDKEKLPPKNVKQKKDIRLNFQSPELRSRFEDVLKQVPGREEEARQVFNYLSTSENKPSAPLCLHGNTGCGKTSLIKKVMDFYHNNVNSLESVYENCMSMRSGNEVYVAILSKLYKIQSSKKEAPEKFMRVLENKKKKEKTKLIILDQIDHFIREDTLLYTLFDQKQIILILISNVIDLVTKLDNKLQSRLGFQTIIFKPYTYHQIETIIKYKYPQIGIKDKTITFLAKKIANINSDIRLLEKLYGRITEEFNRNNQQYLDVKTLNELIQDEETRGNDLLSPYEGIIKIIYNAVINKDNKKQEITDELLQKVFGFNRPKSKDILLILVELK